MYKILGEGGEGKERMIEVENWRRRTGKREVEGDGGKEV